MPAVAVLLFVALWTATASAKPGRATTEDDSCEFAAVTVDEFMALPDQERAARERSAAEWYRKRRNFEAILRRGRAQTAQVGGGLSNLDICRILAQKPYVGNGALRSITWLRHATAVDPRHVNAWIDLASLSEEMCDFGEARAALRGARSALAASSTLPDADRERHLLALARIEAWIAYAECRWSDGLDALAGARDVDLSDPELLLVKGLLLAAAGRAAEANAIARDLPAIKYRVYGKMGVGLRIAHSDYGARWIRARSYLALGQARLALFALGELYPKRKWLPYGDHYWNDVGLVYELNDRPLEAGRFYGAGILASPHFGFYRLGGFSGSPPVLDQPDPRVPYFVTGADRLLGGSRFAYGAQLAAESMAADGAVAARDPRRATHKADMADSSLSRCIRANDRPTAARALRGGLRAARQQDDLAAADLAQAHREFASRGLRHAPTSLLLGIFQLRDGRLGPAIGLLRECTQADSSLASGWLMLGVALARAGQQAEARQAMDRGIAIRPQSADGWYNRGLLAMAGQDSEQTAADLRVASTLDPHDARIATALAHAERHVPHAVAASANADPGSVAAALPRLRAVSTALATAPPRRPRGIGDADTFAANHSFRELERNWRRHPAIERRYAVAAAAVREGLTDKALKILLPAWDRDLSVAEICLVLEEDRLRGDAKRALSLARAVSPDRPEPADPGLWSLVAVICIDQGHGADGRRALDAAIGLDPDNAGLRLFASTIERR